MKIINLQAENIKKLTAVEIRPDGNLVQITGKNGQGKTSVLDSIWWALAGATHIQSQPIHKGATSARIRLDLGEIVVTRTFKASGDDGYTSSIAVENAEGGKFPSPQTMLDQLLGQLTFDPLAFTRMDAKAQFDSLAKFVPGVDFGAIAAQNKADYDRRTEINRKSKEAKAAAAQITVAPDCPLAKVDTTALVAQITKASEANTAREQKRLNRETFTKKAAEDVATATAALATTDARVTAALNKMRADLKAAESAAEAELKACHETLTKAREEQEALAAKIAKAGDLAPLVDTAAIQSQIANAAGLNAQVEDRERRNALTLQHVELDKQAAALTKAIDDREAAKNATIAKSKMPHPAISLSADGLVLFNGVPFFQASAAEQLRVSVAIAMAMNPKLRVVRIKDGSLLDEASLKLVEEMADQNDFQVWVELVGTNGKVGFVLEDGHIKGDTSPAVQAPTPAPVIETPAPAPAAAPASEDFI